VWILGSSAGQSAAVAGKLGLRFAANYHVSPGTVLEAVEAYRAAFQPSPDLAGPYVTVSADVVVAQDDATAAELARGYAPWVRSIRTGEGAIRFPTPREAAEHDWTEADLALIADRTATQFTGSPETVIDKLDALQRVTGADELHITTITHDHTDRVSSYELLAREWYRD
jgi:luciferase family oxidoreductase group 1